MLRVLGCSLSLRLTGEDVSAHRLVARWLSTVLAVASLHAMGVMVVDPVLTRMILHGILKVGASALCDVAGLGRPLNQVI